MERTEKRYFQGLYEVATEVISCRDCESVLGCLVENVARVMEAKGCSLMLLSWDRKLLLHTVAYGLSDSYIKKGLVSADSSISEALDGKAVAISDISQDDRIQYPEAARKEGITSILSLPVTRGGQVIGVIRVYTGEPRKFCEDDEYFVRAIAHLGAIALENAKRYESLQEEYEAFRRLTF